MATLREIRRRITSVKSTQQITKAMKMVAAAKLRRAQDRILATRPYAFKMRDLLADLVRRVDPATNALLAPRAEVNRVLVVVVTADRGLCGAFNSSILRRTVALLNGDLAEMHRAGNVELITVGRYATEFFTKRDYPVVAKHVGVFNDLRFSAARALAVEITDAYTSGRVDQVLVIYNEFKSVIQQILAVEQVLPIPAGDAPAANAPEYLYEPDAATLLTALLPKHLNILFWRVLLESNASEQGARMTAMDSATTNAGELLRSLRLSYNRARQAAITKEILEIVGGAEALSKSEQ